MLQWYAVQVRTGREQATAELCLARIPRVILEDCIIPRFERMRRYQGDWHYEQPPMFPGYIFLVTDQVDILFAKLKQIPNLTKILGDGTEFIPLKQEEVRFLKYMVNEVYIAEMSKGYIIGDVVTVISGPMKEMKGKIKFIDRHKRLAVIEIEMFGRKTEVRLGLEIVKKFSADAKLLEDNYAKDTI